MFKPSCVMTVRVVPTNRGVGLAPGVDDAVAGAPDALPPDVLLALHAARLDAVTTRSRRSRVIGSNRSGSVSAWRGQDAQARRHGTGEGPQVVSAFQQPYAAPLRM